MAWLTDLDDALRAGGIGHWLAPGWERRGHGGMSGQPRGVLIHHTAGGGSNDWRVVQDGRAGLAGPLAHMTLERDGGVRLLAAGQCWHAGTGSHPAIGTNNGNAWCIGVEGVSRGVGNDWTAAQRREYPRVAAALCRHYRLGPDRVIGHKEWTRRKIDPGDWDMGAFRAEVARHLSGGAPAPAGRTHTVARGETLAAIARHYGTTWEVLARHNALPNPNSLREGQVLRIPDTPAPAPAPAPKPVKSAESVLAAFGMRGPGEIVAAAVRNGLDVAEASALCEQESSTARNVWGHDNVDPKGLYTKGAEVTRADYERYAARRKHRSGPAVGNEVDTQGVGPLQITFWALQDECDRKYGPDGGTWNWANNIDYGLGLFAGYRKTADFWHAAKRYNGKAVYADEISRKLAAWRTRLAGTTTASAPGGIESMAFTDTFTDWAGNRQTVESWMEHVDKRIYELHHAMVGASIVSRVDDRPYSAGVFLSATHGDVHRRMDALEAKLDRLLAAVAPGAGPADTGPAGGVGP